MMRLSQGGNVVHTTAQILKQLFADCRRVRDANGLIEHAVTHLSALESVHHVALLIQQTKAPHGLSARAARGISLELVDALGAHAPRGQGTVSADWPAALLPPGLPPGLRYCAVPLAAIPEQVTLLCDGTTEAETLSLMATFLALALERDQAVTDAVRLGELFNAGPVVVFRWRNAPGWPVEYVSPNVTRTLGYSPEQVIDQPYVPLLHTGDLERLGVELAEAMARDVSYLTQQYRMFDGAGQVREVFEFTHMIRDASGAVTHFHGYVFDDGDQARADRARAERVGRLEKAQKLQAVGTLASGIAHDFNNVLAAILAHLELARLEAPLTDNADLAAAMQAALRGRDIVRQLVTFGRNKEPERLPHRLQRIIEDSMGMMRSTIPGTIGLRFSLDAKAPAVMADPTQLQQVLVNLVTNAAHSMPRGGTVDICLATSPGTPARAQLTVKHESQGVTERGVGLSMMQTIVKAHGGTVELTGAGVVITFPGVARPAAALELPLDAVPGNQQRIALVDDEPLVLRATERLVSQFGYRVTSISTGQEVLEAFALKADAFELVLTDQTMPEMTGLELTHALRASGSRVPVLLVTGLPREIDVKSISPPFAVLGKPYRSEELANVLAELLTR